MLWLGLNLTETCRAADEEFESPLVSWKLAQADCPHRFVVHERRRDEAHSGRGSEYVHVEAGVGTYIYLTHEIAPALVIEELTPSVWVKTRRSGLQLLARVVLPHSRDPNTGQPFTALLPGAQTTRSSGWEELRVEQTPRLLERQVRLLRSKYGSDIDTREAYLDRLVLNVYGGVGPTQLWIDDLTVDHRVGASDVSVARDKPAASGDSSAVRRAQYEEPPGQAPPASRNGTEAAVAPPRLRGASFYVDGKPFFPRAIESSGESFRFLVQLGANTIKLRAPPTESELREAVEQNVWLIAPPPASVTDLGASRLYQRVIAWDLGRGYGPAQISEVEKLAAATRSADQNARPLLGEPVADLRNYSRICDILLARRSPLGSSLELSEYQAWLTSRGQLARPGTPYWATIQTEPSSEATDQWLAFARGEGFAGVVDHEQVRMLAFSAAMSGMRGLCFASRTRLDGRDASAGIRAATIEYVNRDLQVIEAWLAAGGNITPLPTGDPLASAALLHHAHADLLLMLRTAPLSQYATAPVPPTKVSLVMPGVSDAAQAYRVFPGGVQPLRLARVAGGVRVDLEDTGAVTQAVLTHDPAVVHHLSRSLSESESRLAVVRQTLAGQLLPLVEEIDARIPRAASISPQTARLDDARRSILQSQKLLEAEDYRGAYRFMDRGLEQLARVRRADWEEASQGFPSPASSPCLTSFYSLPLHYASVARFQSARPGENLLPQGDMEDLSAMVTSQWQRSERTPEGVTAAVDLASERPHGGRFSLRMQATAAAKGGGTTPDFLDGAAAWIAGPPTPVQAGSLVRIHGWVRTSGAIQAGEGLVLYETLSGPGAGLRIRKATDWREFTIYRAVARTDQLRIVAALTGMGEVFLDDLTVQALIPTSDAPSAKVDVIRFPSSPGGLPAPDEPSRPDALPPPSSGPTLRPAK